MSSRTASHAGSWYTSNGSQLSKQLDGWLADCTTEFDQLKQQEGIHKETGSIPKPGARVIIAPHAGYSYSGPAAAWAYKAMDWSKCKRVFLLGPSHHTYLPGCALSQFTSYSTPLGSLPLDLPTIASLKATGKFQQMSPSIDEDEHSLEMHLPYIHKMLSLEASKAGRSDIPPLVPILVGATNRDKEKEFGALLAPYLVQEENCFVVSSDFCHWGLRFDYTYYMPSTAKTASEGFHLKKSARDHRSPSDPRICDSIAWVDKMAMEAIETGKHDALLENLKGTGNTVCGRHPIGVVMAALEVLRQEGKVADGKGLFRFLRYERSSDCESITDSSVSYVSGYVEL
ncbi:hypothetical protein MMC25_007235 [Agyrium rufum]|nr:hypothetical protein [Agyrium rufum]